MSDDKQQDLGSEDVARRAKDGDTEGHRRIVARDDEAGPEGGRRRMPMATDDESDTEGHKK